MQLRLVGPAGHQCPEGTVGEILLRGPAVAQGYVGAESSREAFRDGWFHTGDLGFRYAGQLFVTGRAKEMVVVHGRNFYAEDVESVARAVPGVYRQRCVAFADGEDLVTIAVEVERGTTPGDLVEQIRRELTVRLDLSAVRVRVVPQRWLPQTTSGKWQRQLARDLLATDAQR
jgi:acyl-CoA synthetase (AMP-forming)/AMP-acid ligase II